MQKENVEKLIDKVKEFAKENNVDIGIEEIGVAGVNETIMKVIAEHDMEDKQKIAHEYYEKLPDDIDDLDKKHYADAIKALIYDTQACKAFGTVIQIMENRNLEAIEEEMNSLDKRITKLEKKLEDKSE